MSNASYGIRISQRLPTSGEVQWDETNNDYLMALADVLAERVTPDGLNINANVDAQGNSIIDVKTVGLTPQGDPGTANTLWFGVDGEFYVRDGNNRLLRFTNTGSLNALLNGGIGGQYGSAGAQVTYTTVGTVYALLTPISGTAANLDCGNVHLRQGTNVNYASLQAQVGLASTTVFTFPPGYTTGPSIAGSAAGALVVDATGTIGYASAYYHLTSSVPATACRIGNSTPAYGGIAGGGWTIGAGAATDAVDVPISLDAGDRLDGIDIAVVQAGPGAGCMSASLWISDCGTGTTNRVARFSYNSAVAAPSYVFMGSGTPTLTGTLPYTMPASGSLFLQLEVSNAASTYNFYGVKLYRTVPRR